MIVVIFHSGKIYYQLLLTLLFLCKLYIETQTLCSFAFNITNTTGIREETGISSSGGRHSI